VFASCDAMFADNSYSRVVLASFILICTEQLFKLIHGCVGNVMLLLNRRLGTNAALALLYLPKHNMQSNHALITMLLSIIQLNKNALSI
jgi:hypothetical protein